MAAPPESATHKPHFHRNVSWKQPVRVATTASGDYTTAFVAGQSVDGVTLASGDRVLVKDQGTAWQNGVYDVGTATGTPTRSYDMDNTGEFVGGIIYVTSGGTNGGTLWRCTNTSAPDVGTDSITWDAVTTGGGGNPETLSTVASSGTAQTVDLGVASVFDITLTANCALTFTGATTGEAWSFTLLLRQDGTGGRTVTWPGAVAWADSAPTLGTAASDVDVLTFFTLDGGSVWFGFPTGGGGGGATPASTVTDETTWDIAPAVGTATLYARADHTHGAPANPVSGAAIAATGAVGEVLITDTPSGTPIAFTDLVLTESQLDFLYADLT